VAYPVSYRTQYVEQRSRLRVFFRWALAIPVVFVAACYVVVGFCTVVAAWFALVVTGTYPPALYDFNSNILRASARFTGFLYLQTDRFPPLGLGEHPEYPIQLVVAPAQERYSRVKVFFRLLLGIPVYIVSAAFGYANGAVVIACWFVIVVLGRLPRGMHSAIDFLYGFSVRYYGYLMCLTDRYPTFSDDPDPIDLARAPAGWGPPAGYQSPYGQPPPGYQPQPGYPPPGYPPPGYQPQPYPQQYPPTPQPPQEPPPAPYGGPPAPN
jgi:hypothetical protein